MPKSLVQFGKHMRFDSVHVLQIYLFGCFLGPTTWLGEDLATFFYLAIEYCLLHPVLAPPKFPDIFAKYRNSASPFFCFPEVWCGTKFGVSL